MKGGETSVDNPQDSKRKLDEEKNEEQESKKTKLSTQEQEIAPSQDEESKETNNENVEEKKQSNDQPPESTRSSSEEVSEQDASSSQSGEKKEDASTKEHEEKKEEQQEQETNENPSSEDVQPDTQTQNGNNHVEGTQHENQTSQQETSFPKQLYPPVPSLSGEDLSQPTNVQPTSTIPQYQQANYQTYGVQPPVDMYGQTPIPSAQQILPTSQAQQYQATPLQQMPHLQQQQQQQQQVPTLSQTQVYSGYGYDQTSYYQYPYSGYSSYGYNYPGYSSYQGYYGMQQPNVMDPSSNCRSLYVGNLTDKVTENLLYEIFSTIGAVESCKLIKDKNTNESAGYGFVDFFDHYTAGLALQQLNGKNIYGQDIRVNWAVINGQKEDTSNHFHVFVGDLSPEIDDKTLYSAFSPFGSISEARIMYDPNTNRSRGYGFVAFRRKEDAQRALAEMNGEWLGNRPIRCNWANQKNSANDVNPNLDYNSVLMQAPHSVTTVYIGGVAPDVTEYQIREAFADYGIIIEIRIQGDKGFAFVKYKTHEAAAKAIISVTGKQVGGRIVKCSWGKERNDVQTPVAGTHPNVYGPYTY